MASSASGLAFGLSKLYQLDLTDEELSCIERLGSGSACRSLLEAFLNENLEPITLKFLQAKYSLTITELKLLIIITNFNQKEVSSTEAMMITTPALENRTKNIVPLMISLIKEAFALKKFKEVARIVMQDSDDLLINETRVNYLTNFSNRVKEIVKDFNDEKIRAAYTLDAGPNAWILIRDEDVQNFIQKILQEFRIS